MTPTMGFSAAGRVLVCVHTARDPSDEDWSAWLERVRGVTVDQPRVFVYTAGGAPNGKQRKALFATAGARVYRSAVVSPSRVALAIGTAVSWFSPALKTFSPTQIDNALRYLELDEHDAEAVLKAARGVAQELGLVAAAVDLAPRGVTS